MIQAPLESANPNGLMKDVLAAMQKSQAIKTIGKQPPSKIRSYYLQPHEMWARGYAQFIAEESGNRVLLSGLDKAFVEHSGKQWTEADFKPVKDEIKSLFQKLNWI